MKKVLGIFAAVSVLSVVMMGCQPQAEGDTAPPADGGKAPVSTDTATTPDGK